MLKNNLEWNIQGHIETLANARQDKTYKLAPKESGKEVETRDGLRSKVEAGGRGTFIALILSLNVCD